jgi:hypothetical protein
MEHGGFLQEIEVNPLLVQVLAVRMALVATWRLCSRIIRNASLSGKNFSSSLTAFIGLPQWILQVYLYLEINMSTKSMRAKREK